MSYTSSVSSVQRLCTASTERLYYSHSVSSSILSNFASYPFYRRHHLIHLSSASCRQPMQTLIRQCTLIIEAQQVVLRHCFVLWFSVNHFCFQNLYLFISARSLSNLSIVSLDKVIISLLIKAL